MSLSRPVQFPLLKLPWLCIRCVIHNSHPVGLIYFATISNRTRRIVKSANYPVQEIDVSLNRSSICMGKGKYWYFTHNKNEFGVPLVLRRNSEPFLTGASFVPNIGSYLHSYTDGDTLDALKIGIEFMIDVFGCTVGKVSVAGDKLSELLRLGISSVKKLYIGNSEPVNITDLKYVLENIKVTDKYVFYVPIPANFSCDPQIFKCRKLDFGSRSSADWVTLEILCQFNIPQLSFSYHWFSNQDIVLYVTHWFNSENRKLEYLHIHFNNSISLEDFEIDHLYPMPFCKKRRSRWSLIYFATISNRTRRIVRSSNYPLKEIEVGLVEFSEISINDLLGNKYKEKFWYFTHDTYEYDDEFLLQIKSQPFRTREYIDRWGTHYLESYTAGDKVDVLKMGIEFMIDVFGCTIRKVIVDGDKILELIGLGVSSVKELFISEVKPVIITDLKYLLESIKVTDEYVFCAHIPANFSCDPQIFKCRLLLFAGYHSAGWVTLELLCQFDVPQLTFWFHRFSVEDIVSYITHWFNSENRKLEYVQFQFRNLISLEGFEIAHLSPMPFCEKRRSKCPLAGKWKYTDISSGMDILRKDGLLATFFVKSTSAFFYIWHKRFPDAV